MAKIGRNAPCPCGSGKKYKRCCLNPSQEDYAPYTTSDRQSALSTLSEFVEQPERSERDDRLIDEFYADVDDVDDSDEFVVRTSEMAFDFWAWFDTTMFSDRLTVDELLSSDVHLTAGERRYLTMMRGTAMKLYEVVVVHPGKSLTLRHVLDGAEVTVRERTASRSLHRWATIAARVAPRGASGLPEMDGGCLPIHPMRREGLEDFLKQQLARFVACEPNRPEIEFHKRMAPILHSAWRNPIEPPKMVNYDGEPIVFTTVFFDVVDRASLITALDGSTELERASAGSERWSWVGVGRQRTEPVVYGFFSFVSDRLRFETNSSERGERGRTFVDALAGECVVYRTTTIADPTSMMTSPTHEARPLSKLSAEQQEQLQTESEALMSAHYDTWLDEPVPRLDDQTPRRAARSRRLRPRVLQMLKEMEQMYERALDRGDPAYDPIWMWDELKLPNPRGQGAHPPRLGHESMAALVQGLEVQARQTVERVRRDEGYALDRTIRRDELLRDLGFQRFVREHARAAVESYADLESAMTEAELLATHLEIRCNFELHLRKVFWVDEALSWMLGATSLDITGEALRLPFGCFAVALTDRYALGLAERALARDPTSRLRGRILEIVTAYVMRLEDVPAGGTGLRVALTCDIFDEDWPYLLVRDLWIKPGMRLDDMLKSHVPGVDTDELAPIFSCPPLRRLLQLIINVILYATSQDAETEPREPAARNRRRDKQTTFLSSERVFFLPGTIDIKHVREIQRARRGASSREQVHRCMVRGHWRGANKGWKDQRARWIKPYWRGPSAAAIVERQYRLQP